MNPLNQLPTDPAFIEAVDKAAEALSAQLGATVVIVAAQPDKKMMVTTAGEELTQPGRYIATQGIHGFFAMLALIGKANDIFDKANPQ